MTLLRYTVRSAPNIRGVSEGISGVVDAAFCDLGRLAARLQREMSHGGYAACEARTATGWRTVFHDGSRDLMAAHGIAVGGVDLDDFMAIGNAIDDQTFDSVHDAMAHAEANGWSYWREDDDSIDFLRVDGARASIVWHGVGQTGAIEWITERIGAAE